VVGVGLCGILMSYEPSMEFSGCNVCSGNSDVLSCETNKTRSTCVILRLCYSHIEKRDLQDFRDGGSTSKTVNVRMFTAVL
jgi:hypothetical protein